MIFFMSKRKKFVFTSLLLSLGFIAIRFFPDNFKILSILLLGCLSLIFFVWSLWGGLGINTTLLTLILPLYFTVGVGLFWFLLPANAYTIIPVILVYAFGIYALSLTANIYTVAVIRTIALMRAARGVGFVITLFTFFLVFDTIISLHLSVLITAISVTLLSFPLFLQSLWSINLEEKLSSSILVMSVIASLVLGEISTNLFFWPLTVVVRSLFLTLYSYIVLGLGQAELEGRLFKETVREYLLIGGVVFLGMFLSTDWGR